MPCKLMQSRGRMHAIVPQVALRIWALLTLYHAWLTDICDVQGQPVQLDGSECAVQVKGGDLQLLNRILGCYDLKACIVSLNQPCQCSLHGPPSVSGMGLLTKVSHFRPCFLPWKITGDADTDVLAWLQACMQHCPRWV